MEEQLDEVEQGKEKWKDLLHGFYGGFSKELKAAEADVGERIRVPDEVSEEICPLCGKNLVFKSGKFGRFLACPGWPDCPHTQPIVEQMPGKCPKCGGRLLKRSGTSKKNGKPYTYYACEFVSTKDEARKCDFMTFDVPVADTCPQCGQTMFKLSGRGAKKPFCINDKCPNFLPEDKRGYYKKKEEGTGEKKRAPAKKKTAAKKK